MVEIITETDGLSGKIQQIIKFARDELYIVSPYVKLKEWPRIHDAIEHSLRVGQFKKIYFFVREQQDSKIDQIVAQLAPYLDRCQISLVKDLHAKVYFNGDQALIASMNLYETSAQSNFEIGVWFSGAGDAEHLQKVRDFILFLENKSTSCSSKVQAFIELNSAESEETSKAIPVRFKVSLIGRKWVHVETSEGYKNKILIENVPQLEVGEQYEARARRNWKRTPFGYDVELYEIEGLALVQGYCIACGSRVDLDPTHPLCKPCYFRLKQYRGNIFGKVCHACGKEASDLTDMKPLCKDCFTNDRVNEKRGAGCGNL